MSLLVGFAFGIGILVSVLTGHLAAPQRWEYSEIATHLLDGQGAFHNYLGTKYYFYGPALYPLMLGAVLWISGGQETVMVVLQALVFALTCLVIYRIADLLSGKTTALLAAFLAVFHPGNLVYIGKLHAQTVDVCLIALSFLLLFKVTIAAGPIGPLKAVGIGLVLGLAALSRGIVMPFCACWAVWWVWQRQASANSLRVVTLIVAGGLLAVAPILVRGYQRYGRLIPLRTDTGVNLWYGNHRGASGTSYTLGPAPVPVVSELPPALASRLVGKTEVEQHALFTEATLDFIHHQPAAALWLFFKKLSYFWWFSPHTGLLYPAAWAAAYRLYYGLALAWAIVGLVVCLRSGQSVTVAGTQLFALLAVSASVTQACFYVEGRHRWQLEPLLLIFTAAGLLRCLRWIRRNEPAGALAVHRTAEHACMTLPRAGCR